MKNIFIAVCMLFSFFSCSEKEKMVLLSPSGNLTLYVKLTNGQLVYSLFLSGDTILADSPLGIVTENADFSQNLRFVGMTGIRSDGETYRLYKGKAEQITQVYYERSYTVMNAINGDTLKITFRLFDDGLAFSYRLGDFSHRFGSITHDVVVCETTGFKFPENTTAFISPLAKAKTFWARTNPSYEDQYQRNIPVGSPSDYGQGWVFPALFRIGDRAWVLLSETGVDGGYVATHLADNSEHGLYKIEFPHPDQNLPEDPATAAVQLPFMSPWRMVVVGKTLHPIVASSMAQDLVKVKYSAKYDFKPGKASWSWLTLKDNSVDPKTSQKFIDLAAELHFEYCLIDGWWDRQTGREGMEKLSEYARAKGVGLLLWYNSNGNWNDAPQTPIDRMADRIVRRNEMAWMQSIGITGIKVDFFGGDKQRVMQLYEDILTDANDYGLVVNFHGCTLPRGWDRMFPNFVTDEAVMGMEFCTFEQANEDKRPVHATTLPFTRNVVAPMDFTPVILNPRLGVKPGTGPVRVTSSAFELALPVVFQSGIEHFGLIPANLRQFPDFVWTYFREVPSAWSETRLIDGYPGRDVVIARRRDSIWYVAGINGENTAKTFSFKLPFPEKAISAMLITEKNGSMYEVEQREITVEKGTPIQIQTVGYGGFVLIINSQ
ncbi:MAG: glycoside hydrolase family 97 protein [Bacteroidales bacterium]|jgi:hypothetical protein|nr:glycoside hydrolase family 97 protein [Bacteroidales bacterium]